MLSSRAAVLLPMPRAIILLIYYTIPGSWYSMCFCICRSSSDSARKKNTDGRNFCFSVHNADHVARVPCLGPWQISGMVMVTMLRRWGLPLRAKEVAVLPLGSMRTTQISRYRNGPSMVPV